MDPADSRSHISTQDGLSLTNRRGVAQATSAYIGVAQAWSSFKSATLFSNDVDDIALRLYLERFRLEAWGRLAGLEQNDLIERLLPVSDLIVAVLEKLRRLFTDADQLQSKYGLVNDSASMRRWRSSTENESSVASKEPVSVEKIIAAIRNTRQGRQGRFQISDSVDVESIAETASIRSSFTKRLSQPKKTRWIFKDRDSFINLLQAIDTHLQQLNSLFPDLQTRSMLEERSHINILIVGNVVDRSSLSLVRRSALLGKRDLSLCWMIERKGISDALEFSEFSEDQIVNRQQNPRSLVNLNASDFYMPDKTNATRFITTSRTWHGSIVLLERKDFPDSADPADVEKFEARMQRLALLLSNANSDLGALRATGYFADLTQPCWWLAFEFPLRQKQTGAMQVPIQLTASTRPISLYRMISNRSSRWKPALEDRLRLANKLALTLSALYSSGWTHKSLRSANVLFPYIYSRKGKTLELDSIEDISKPMLAGFEYSLPDRRNWESIIYWHPQYQSGPRPYRIHYDIYAFGLMLVEIALWMPLHDFLDANASDFVEEFEARGLPPKANDFTAQDALELQKRVLRSVKTNMAYLMSRHYREAAKWCLTYADADQLEAEHEPWAPALEFYDRVVVPLGRLTRMGSE